MWSAIVTFAKKYGIKALVWAWNHKSELIALGSAAYDVIKKLFG